MRLQPIENPKGLLVRLAYYLTKKSLGQVISPLKVIYARRPLLLPMVDKIVKYQEKTLSISNELKQLIKAYCAQLNHCAFCQDIALAEILQQKLGEEKFKHMHAWRESHGVFSPAEQSVLAFVDEYSQSKSISDETYSAMRQHFSEVQLIDIVAVHAIEQYFNAMNIPFEIESDRLADEIRYQFQGTVKAV